MTDLIARLEQAEGPSRELDEAICLAIGRPLTFDDGVVHGCNVWPYTSSIDAALTLVPKSWEWTLRRRHCELRHPVTRDLDTEGMAATPALAICIASLRAREAK